MASPTPRAIVSKVRGFIRRHDVLRPGPLVLAVSGGTDSTALALVLAELAPELGLVLHVAHFDHRTRPADAAEDAQFVADLAARIGAPIRLGRATRPARSEDDARRERYAFLRRAAGQVGATVIATGHTLDDQAETVLLHLVRGSGLAGAGGMRPLRDGIARPLLSLTRAETAAICRAGRITPREDPSNASLRFARNRVRLRILPELEALNPKVREALARFADAAAEAEAALTAVAPTRGRSPDAIDVASLPAERALRGRALANAYRAATGATLTERHRAALTALASTTSGTRRIDLPRATAVREYGVLRFEERPASARADADAARGSADAKPGGTDETPLARGSSVEWHGWRIGVDMQKDGLTFTAAVDAASASRLAVRARRPGDRLSERGKLQDLFVDAKIPARLRDRWPVVTLAGAVFWVPGLSEPPRTGRIALGAGPVGDDLTDAAGVMSGLSHRRRVASTSEARPRGGKRGRP